MMKSAIRENHGFTLVELMIVIAVIGILAAIAIPSYLGIQRKSARSEAKANLQAIALALEGFMAENNRYGADGTNYWYRCGDNCIQTTFSGGLTNLARMANLGGKYEYDYQVMIRGTGSVFTVWALPVRGYVARDNGVADFTPSIDSTGAKGPTAFW